MRYEPLPQLIKKNPKQLEERTKVSNELLVVKKLNEDLIFEEPANIPEKDKGKFIYVIKCDDPDTIYYMSKYYEYTFHIHHHILAENKSVYIAGNIKYKNNEIMFDNESGHYKPPLIYLNFLKEILIKKYNLTFARTEPSRETKLYGILRRDYYIKNVSDC